jgi:membrane peptidoglycan carboxypeptidase
VLGLLSFFLVGLGGAGVAYYEVVVRSPGPHLAREHVLATIAQESPVYYADGTTRLGTFFEGEHRELVGWPDLPPAYTAALVAAEDDGYWSHFGIDPWGLGRAMLANVQAGTLVAGGSTLTQQTAKNLFDRPDRSLQAKAREALDALRLEAHYEKYEILTFYANQFHVSGNGRGVAIGARYFFDKEVSELTLLESAFLAGLVKGPANYDPFLGDAQRQERNRQRAHDRTRYVLRRLAEVDVSKLVGHVPGEGDATRAARLASMTAAKTEAEQLLGTNFVIPFKRGEFRYDADALLDEVGRRIAEAPFDSVFAAAAIADPATAGLQVVTTLDADVQFEAIYALWHHLTVIGTQLEALGPESYLRPGSAGPKHDPYRKPRIHTFTEARVVGKAEEKGKPTLLVDLGGHPCTIDRPALTRVKNAMLQGERGTRRAIATSAQVDTLVAAWPEGSVLWVSVREDSASGRFCDVEVRPRLQGAVVVVEQGKVRAMVGGNDQKNFNRATALRQLGSTWKPLVYQAAIELGWNPTDSLDNALGAFPTGGSWYYPGAAHPPPPEVSLNWAGVHSENPASVWLTFHLTDRLDGRAAWQLAQELDLAPRPSEADDAWRARLKKLGIHLDAATVAEGRFLRARREVAEGLRGTAAEADAMALRTLFYGNGVPAERARVARERGGAAKAALLGPTWLEIAPWVDTCQVQLARLREAWAAGRSPAAIPDLSFREEQGTIEVACGDLPDDFGPFLPAWLPEPEPAATPVRVKPPPPVRVGVEAVRQGRRRIQRIVTAPSPESERVDVDEPVPVWSTPVPVHGETGPRGRSGLTLAEDALVHGALHLSTVIRVQRQMVAESADPWAQANVVEASPFRVALGLRFLTRLAETYGVRTELQEVLSISLGAGEVTLEEMALVYGGLTSGVAWSFPGQVTLPDGSPAEVESPVDPALLIEQIRDIDGNVLYQARSVPREVTSTAVAAQTADILRNVVRFGTGTDAAKLGLIAGGQVPMGGKTGTTNNYKNAAFIGFAPKATPSGWDAASGYTIAVYVGYDDNTPMKNKSIALAGASGALPVWNHVGRTLIAAGRLGTPGTKAPGSGWALDAPSGLVRYAVDATTGLPFVDGTGMPMVAGGSGASVLAEPADRLSFPLASVALERPRGPRVVRPTAPGPGGSRGIWGWR